MHATQGMTIAAFATRYQDAIPTNPVALVLHKALYYFLEGVWHVSNDVMLVVKTWKVVSCLICHKALSYGNQIKPGTLNAATRCKIAYAQGT